MEGLLSMLDSGFMELSNWGCSPFFVTSSVMSVVLGSENRKQTMINAYEDEYFRKLLQIQQEKFEDQKEAEEWAFKKWIISFKRNNAKIRAKQQLQNELSKSELKQVFDEWPLKVSIESAIDSLSDFKANQNLAIIMGRLPTKQKTDSIAKELNSVITSVRDIIDKYATNREYFYTFVENSKITGGAAIANIYSCLNAFPIMIIQPILLNKKIQLSIGLWTSDSLYPRIINAASMELDNSLAVNNKEYLISKELEIQTVITSIICITNDIYRAIEFHSVPVFPKMVKDLKYDNSFILEYAKKEYMSIASGKIPINYKGQIIEACDYLFDPQEINMVKDLMFNAIQSLKQ